VPVPGQNEPGNGNAGQQAFAAPVPGEQGQDGKSGSGLGTSDQIRAGEGKGGMLSAPIPGMDSGAPTPGSGLATSGNSAAGQSGQGGDQAGTGTAKMTDSQSDVLKAKSDSKVLAQSGRDGESSMRAIDGGTRTEQAERTRQELVTEFLSVEEQALDDQSLPMSRRQHVLRYFSAIRQQFEKPDAK
ncbi:MAG TPA: hypothetical protein PLA50_09800, partial [Bacteroidia bacterium]|nr:hypothetical protein [Bacteroidia bacterium]